MPGRSRNNGFACFPRLNEWHRPTRPTMKKTLYQKRGNRFVPIKEWHEFDYDPATPPLTRLACKGCGISMTLKGLLTVHVCTGKLTDEPIDRYRLHPYRIWQPGMPWPEDPDYEKKMKEYVKTLPKNTKPGRRFPLDVADPYEPRPRGRPTKDWIYG